jgi:hypothetical protein
MTIPALPAQFQATFDCLRQVNRDTLERKRRLGHYVVLWRDGKVVAVGEDAPPELREDAIAENSTSSEEQQSESVPE